MKRYLLNGTQLEILKLDKEEARKEILKEVEENQFIGETKEMFADDCSRMRYWLKRAIHIEADENTTEAAEKVE